MLSSLISYLACPACGGVVALAPGSKTNAAGSVVDGYLLCDGCPAMYPVTDGIPRMMHQGLLAAQVDEMTARDSQVVMYDNNTFLHIFGRFEIPLTLRFLDPKSGDLLLEAGCGTGRMTPILSHHVRELVAIDFSFASLKSNKRKLDASGITNVHLVQADLCKLPFKSAVFDRVLSCQVLEHVPGDEARTSAVASIARVARPGARVVVSAYQHSAIMGAKEGRHAGGIPFFRFTKPEFKALLGKALQVDSVTGSLVYLHLARCNKALGA